MKQSLNAILGFLGYRVLRDSPLLFHGQEVNKLYREAPWIKYWLELSDAERRQISPFLWASKAQLGQDLFAFVHSQKFTSNQPPFFVDIGASDGVRFSNSWMLEKQLGWQGIAVEPARCWAKALNENRDCAIDNRAVYSVSGQNLNFLDVSNRTGYRELSSLAAASASDDRSAVREADPTTYEVETITLNDLLDAHNAPAFIDFLSIDTEGSELAILNAFDFKRHRIGLACVEHNYNKTNRAAIHSLMVSQGYTRAHEKASAWDDWYLLTNLEQT